MMPVRYNNRIRSRDVIVDDDDGWGKMQKPELEGVLWKWTNYFSGWQPRWFALDSGILSYYKSRDDVSNGCKGSLKMTVCDVMVHPHDPTRLDLIIPGEQHFYLKAGTAQERQQWLVALGSSKACEHSSRQSNGPDPVSPDEIRVKRSELRLYCDLLMQQVHSVKQAVSDEKPDVEKMDEATGLLRATCDTFIQTLDDCMSLVNAKSQSNAAALMPDTSQLSSPVKGILKRQTSRSLSQTSGTSEG